LAIGAMLMTLAGCGGGEPADGNTAAASKAKPAARGGGSDVRLRPGQWEMKINMDNKGFPDLPAEVAEKMRNAVVTSTNCLTDADIGEPGVFTGNPGQNCKTQNFSNKNGRISGTTVCGGPGGGQVTTKVEGNFTPESFDTTANMITQGPSGKMTSDIRIVARRLGECPAGAKDEVEVDGLEDNLGRKRVAG
jgi:hypothetical protein